MTRSDSPLAPPARLPRLTEQLIRSLPHLQSGDFRAAVAPLIDQLRSTVAPAELDGAFEAVLGALRWFYSQGRSSDALPVAQALLEAAERSGDSVMQRRALAAGGLIRVDAGDFIGGIERHLGSLRLASAQEAALEVSRAWNNIGLAFGNAGAYELAVRCYERSLASAAALPDPVHPRYAAHANLASSHYQLGDIAQGLEHGQRALSLHLATYTEGDPHDALLLHRNLVRLLVAARRIQDAAPHVEAIAELAARSDSVRSRIAAATAQATYELATGRSDVALTRVDLALASARQIPAALRETLLFAVHAEEAAGHPDRALERLHELSDNVYRAAIDRVRLHVELAALDAQGPERCEDLASRTRARLTGTLRPRPAPEGWGVLQRFAAAAVLPMDPAGEHGERVGALARTLALAAGCAPLEALEIGAASEVHDIGLASVPAHILARRAPLRESERQLVRRHADASAEVLYGSHHPRFLLARDIAKYHHARWDGTGHPDRVGGTFIPRPARICAIADAYDAMVCGLYGRAPRPMAEALDRLREGAGAQFDPELVDTFVAAIRTHSAEHGIDISERAGRTDFAELIESLQEDRGFI